MKKNKCKKQGLSPFFRTLLIIIGLPITIVVAIFLYAMLQNFIYKPTPKPTAPVIGDLGGVPVAIPRSFARFVEYDKDPHFMEKRRGKKPVRDFQSRLRSFGFRVRYPDMASVKVRTKAEKDIHTTMWMWVGISTGEDYGIEEYLDVTKKRYINNEAPCYSKCFIYGPLPDKTYGLTGYTPTGSGVDVEKRSVNFGRGTSMGDKNIYFFQNDSGHVTTFIKCSNRTHTAATCQQLFSLFPIMKANIRVSYRKGLLPHWQQIQQSVSNLIYSFEATETNISKLN